MTKRSDDIAAALQAAGAIHAAKNPKVSNARRQTEFRERMEAEGFVQVTGWVRRDNAAAVASLIRLLREDPDLEPGPMRNTRTGRLRKLA